MLQISGDDVSFGELTGLKSTRFVSSSWRCGPGANFSSYEEPLGHFFFKKTKISKKKKKRKKKFNMNFIEGIYNYTLHVSEMRLCQFAKKFDQVKPRSLDFDRSLTGED